MTWKSEHFQRDTQQLDRFLTLLTTLLPIRGNVLECRLKDGPGKRNSASWITFKAVRGDLQLRANMLRGYTLQYSLDLVFH